jgi:L-seryl-tRNA(Ser) seleniumtransferase
MKVHPSNYRISGFTEETSVKSLATLGVPVVVDLGSGLIDDACSWLQEGRPSWLGEEPAVKQTLESGADLVTFSCDKLFGGPQAGVIAGRSDLVEECANHPLMRAFRPGALVLNALQQTALAYLRRDGDSIPFWRMAQTPVTELLSRADAMSIGRTVHTMAMTGGGSLPGEQIPSAGVEIDGDISRRLRDANTPVIARVHDQTTVIDLRTVDPGDDSLVVAAVASSI